MKTPTLKPVENGIPVPAYKGEIRDYVFASLDQLTDVGQSIVIEHKAQSFAPYARIYCYRPENRDKEFVARSLEFSHLGYRVWRTK
jgi:hypothetical protein